MKKYLMLSILLLSMVSSPSYANLGLAVKEGTIVPKQNPEQVLHVKDGFYLTQQEGVELATGIRKLQADLEIYKEKAEAYKIAYEKQVDVTSEYAKLLEDMYLKYDARVKETEKLIAAYDEKDDIRQKQIRETKNETNTYKLATGVLLIGLLISLF